MGSVGRELRLLVGRAARSLLLALTEPLEDDHEVVLQSFDSS